MLTPHSYLTGPTVLFPHQAPFLPGGIATPSPARHDAAATMMSLLHVRTVDDSPAQREADPMSPPQMRVLKRGRAQLSSQGLVVSCPRNPTPLRAVAAAPARELTPAHTRDTPHPSPSTTAHERHPAPSSTKGWPLR